MSGKSTNVFRATVMTAFVLGLPLVAFVLAIVLSMAQHADGKSPFFYIGIGLMAFGWAILVRSKWDQIRRGEWAIFGVDPKSSSKMRWLYRLSYVVMLIGYLTSTFSGKF